MAGQYVSEHERQSWKLIEENQEQANSSYLRSASNISRIPGEEGRRIRNEQEALDGLQTRRAEHVIESSYQGMSRNVVAAFREHGLNHAEQVAVVKQLLRVDLMSSSPVNHDAQVDICQRILKARTNYRIEKMSYAELKSLINVSVFELGKAGEHSQKYIRSLLAEKRETQRHFRDEVRTEVRKAEHQETMAGYERLYRAGHYDAIGENLRKKFFNEIDRPRIDQDNKENPSSRLVFSSKKDAKETAQLISRELERDPEYAKTVFAPHIQGLESSGVSLPERTSSTGINIKPSQILFPPGTEAPVRKFSYFGSREAKERLPEIEKKQMETFVPKTAPGLSDIAQMKDTFRVMQKAHKLNEGAGKNVLLSKLQGFSTEELKRMLSSAESYDRNTMFRQPGYEEKERLSGLSLFDNFEDTLRAAIAHRENLIPGSDYRLEYAISPEALAHTFLQDEEAFSSVLKQSNITKEVLNNALDKTALWSKTASAAKADALGRFRLRLMQRQGEVDKSDMVIT